MRKALLLLIIILASCKPKLDTQKLQAAIAKAYQEETLLDVKSVELIRKDDYLYEGFITMQDDDSKIDVEVTIDKDDPTRYIWKAAPNAALIQKKWKTLFPDDTDSNISSDSSLRDTMMAAPASIPN